MYQQIVGTPGSGKLAFDPRHLHAGTKRLRHQLTQRDPFVEGRELLAQGVCTRGYHQDLFCIQGMQQVLQGHLVRDVWRVEASAVNHRAAC